MSLLPGMCQTAWFLVGVALGLADSASALWSLEPSPRLRPVGPAPGCAAPHRLPHAAAGSHIPPTFVEVGIMRKGECVVDADCRPGEVCLRGSFDNGKGTVCVPRSSFAGVLGRGGTDVREWLAKDVARAEPEPPTARAASIGDALRRAARNHDGKEPDREPRRRRE